MSIEKLDIEEKKRIFKDYCADDGDIIMVPYINFLFSPDRDTGSFDEIRKKVFGLEKINNNMLASNLLHNTTDIEKSTKIHGEPIKSTEFGEFGDTLDAMYTFILKIDGKVVMFHVDDRGTSFEIEATEDVTIFDDGPKISTEYFYSIYEQVLEYLKESYSDEVEKYKKFFKEKA